MSMRLREVVETAAAELAGVDKDRTALRPAPGKWSAREIVGHLIDSATNNHRRFVLAQWQQDLVFEGYAQDSWVRAQDYQSADWDDLFALWRLYNLHLAHVMDAVPDEIRMAVQTKHNFHRIAFRSVPEGAPTTLGYLMDDYVDHLEHHLRQVRALLGG